MEHTATIEEMEKIVKACLDDIPLIQIRRYFFKNIFLHYILFWLSFQVCQLVREFHFSV